MHELTSLGQTVGALLKERKQTIAEQIRSAAIRAVEIVLGARGRRIDNTSFRINGEFTPDIGAADALPGVLRPGIVAELAGTRNRVKGPD